ncbi:MULTISPECIES: thiosulfate oxidation carrier protein SoxY [Pseudorhizobium]|jgi:sulfur-oxidizing protein SoxY|uniref:Sulfur-oxidizing protein SoxY n=2 Tax=Pseudorhizobium TaxID=1903858 RepID=A0A7W9YTS9_9HYPH|nr:MULTISPECIES: thiosulfate oxidation carrier protein SoxY [Pseudorhizobium]MBB6178194.1 sulfur-oxidizing protein SoxY [Pseudorhizobium flavum]CAD6601175.1 thiosulfate oxidation carrier protein SoxY [Rhizobium sp. Khangiran2]CAD6614240.1 thiosulfate oxidation carrier protein SoxY [Pseudorhizobium flavum]CAD7055107.1 thiosulfate oxidation carrier protein SoxY [Pseudorhizobium halotolerans]
MSISRRQMLGVSAGFALMSVAGTRIALADVEATDKFIMEFTGGKKPETGKITLTAPEIAENGNTVPVSVEVESAMTDGDLVESVLLVADGNPNPDVATFHFTAMSGTAAATTRMRLAKTQNVIAVAKMADGSVFMDKKEVKVTIGGCGG